MPLKKTLLKHRITTTLLCQGPKIPLNRRQHGALSVNRAPR